MLTPITFRPGIQKNLTEYLAEGGWVDCDKIRFRNGTPIKLGGWAKDTVIQNEGGETSFTGIVRNSFSWSALDTSKFLVAGSDAKVEILSAGEIFDATPVRESPSLTDVLSTTLSSTLVQVTDTNHNLVVEDYVYVNSQANPVGGITLSGSYQVDSLIDGDNYYIDSGVAANATVGLSGGAFDIDYLLENGFSSNEGTTGWGGGSWGTEGESGQGWNRPRSGVGSVKLRKWSFDEWGEDLVANVEGGKIYHWDRTNGAGSRLAELSNAPSQNTTILVAQPSRFLVAFGSEVEATSTFDPLIVRWAEQETLNDWTTTATNTAGEFRLPKGNRIVTAVQTRSEIIIFTETIAYSMRYIGGNNIFKIEPLGTNITIASKDSVIDENGVLRWIGTDGFYMYDGVIRKVGSSVHKYIFDKDSPARFNFDQKEKIHVGMNKEFNEAWWFYPRSTETEISDYVKINYLENTWDIGTLSRTSWLDQSVFEKPYAFDVDGLLYVHEQGSDDDGKPMNSFIRSGYFDIGDGDDIMLVDKVVPDIKLDTNKSIEISFLMKYYPHPNAKIVTKGPYYFDDSDDKIDFRARGRAMSIKYVSNVTGGDFEIGKTRINIKPDGKR